MASRSLYLGSAVSDLSAECVSNTTVGTPPSPEEILIITQNSESQDRLAETWDHEHPPIAATVTTLPDVVDRWVEASQGPTELLDTVTRRRLIENALASVELDEESPIDDVETLVTPFTTLLTAIEDGGLSSPATLSATLDDTDVPPATADVLVTLLTEFLDQQASHLEAGVSSQAQQYRAVLDDPDAFTDAFPDVHTVIFEGFYSLTELQWELLDALPSDIAVEAVLAYPEWDGPAGATDSFVGDPAAFTSNQLLTETLERYCSLGFEPVAVDPPQSCSVTAARWMYNPSADDIELDDSVRWRELPSPREEVRTVARDIRAALNEGESAESFTVVVPGMLSYREFLTDLFDAYEIPYAIKSNKTLGQTLAGNAVQALVALSGPQPDASQLVSLLTNPLVDLETLTDVSEAEVEEIHRTVSATHDRTVETVLRNLDGPAAAELQRIFDMCQELAALDPEAAIGQLQSLFTQLGLTTAIDELSEREDPSFDTVMEVRAFQSVKRQLESVLTTTDTMVERTGRAAIRAALSTEMVSPPSQSTDGKVSIIGLRDTSGRSFEQAILLGALDEHLPARTETPAFFERVYDTVDEIETRNEFAHARYLTRLLLANADDLLITTPAESVDGEPLLQSAILTELVRVSDLEADTSADERTTTKGEIQRAAGNQRDPSEAARTAHEAGNLSETDVERIHAGAETASARAVPESSPHNARVDTEVVERLDRLDPDAAISPSRLNKYAKCGFRYFASHGLKLSEPNSIEPLPHSGMVGTLIHEVLREAFERLQESPDTPVILSDADRPAIERTVLEAAQHVIEIPTRDSLAAFEWGTDAAFARQQFEELFAGLGTAEANPYFDMSYPHAGTDRGLFARFLDVECDGASSPMHFEYPFGGVEDTEAGHNHYVEIDTPRGTAKLRGQIDRIDRVVTENDPDEVRVWDYKSGTVPSTKRTLEGTDFQLATYLQAALESLRGDVRVADGHYYEVSPPGTANPKDGLSDAFDSTAEFDAFLHSEYPARLAQLQTGLENGAFQPTYLDEKAAGCEYCSYRSACDVRHHRRHERVDALSEDHVEYVPPGITAIESPFMYAPDAEPLESEADE